MESNKIDRAYKLAEKAHKEQLYGKLPYIYHLEETANQAKSLGYSEDIIVACILHDTLEDTEVSYNTIKNMFGEEVAEIVYCITDEVGSDRRERKQKTYPKIHGNWKATVVKICDRIANIEHCINTNKGLLGMYLNEHDEFHKSLINEEHGLKTKKAWDKLNNLINNILNK